MSDIQLMIVRRLRAPLIVLIVTYAVSVFGLALMPGSTPDGQPWRLSLFDAFYVMTYTATTIGFGEVPYPFSYAQRLWMTFSIYLGVTGWAYALGSVFALVQHPSFRIALARSRFDAGVRRLVDRFYVICGYGQSGRRLAEALDHLGYATVVIDSSPEKLRPLHLQDTAQPAIGVVGDARLTELLADAGIRRRECQGLIALTGDDETNQTIAIEARVLAPELPVLARIRSETAKETLAAFGRITIVDPYETFATNLGMALAQPDMLRLEDWLTGAPGSEPPARIEAPHGHWVLAGYGRFGRAIGAVLTQAGMTWKPIDVDPARCAEDGIVGTGLAADALREAGIETACGIVVSTDNDAHNLAIVTAARRVQPKLFVVIRQNRIMNRSLIDAARADMRFVQSRLMAHECVQLMTTPLLNRFLMLARTQGNAWAVGLCGRIRDVVGNRVPHTWRLFCDPLTLGICRALKEQPEPGLQLGHLLCDPDHRGTRLAATPLLLLRGGRDMLLPDENTAIEAEDQILFAGEAVAEQLQLRLLGDDVAIDYVRTGRERPRTWVGRWLERPA